jgi:hypothetical protein
LGNSSEILDFQGIGPEKKNPDVRLILNSGPNVDLIMEFSPTTVLTRRRIAEQADQRHQWQCTKAVPITDPLLSSTHVILKAGVRAVASAKQNYYFRYDGLRPGAIHL